MFLYQGIAFIHKTFISLILKPKNPSYKMFDHPIRYPRFSPLTTPTENLADTNEKAFAPLNGESLSETPVTETRKARWKKGKAFLTFQVFLCQSSDGVSVKKAV